MKTTSHTVNASPMAIATARQFASRTIYVDPGAQDIYIGGSDVTTTTGVKLRKNDITEIILPPNEALYAISGTGAHTVLVLEPTT